MRFGLGFVFLILFAAACGQNEVASQSAGASEPFGIKDWSSLKITLARAGCGFTCPIYEVELAGDGAVRYCGIDYVDTPGRQTRMVSIDKVRALARMFEDTRFLSLANLYDGQVADAGKLGLQIEFDGQKKYVVDDAGDAAGMPASVALLADAVDEIGITKEWIGSSEKRVPDEYRMSAAACHMVFSINALNDRFFPRNALSADGATKGLDKFLDQQRK